MERMNGKLKFKKEPTKFRDTFLFVLIFLLCAATVVTIQIKSKRDASTADTVSNTESCDQRNDGSFVPSEPSDETSTAPTDDMVFADGSDKRVKETQDTKEYTADETDAAAAAEIETPVADTPKIMNFAAPCGGDVIKKFSDSELLYSKTMDDWRIHLGVDIAVPIGTKITACESGIAEEIKNDPEYGNTVVIRHDNILTKYSNLASENLPTVGDKISKGDIIGVVGDSAGSEVLDESHLHFAMCEDNIYIDPSRYIKFALAE